MIALACSGPFGGTAASASSSHPSNSSESSSAKRHKYCLLITNYRVIVNIVLIQGPKPDSSVLNFADLKEETLLDELDCAEVEE
jgi:hypothetical protein